jgi:hypothetical protein
MQMVASNWRAAALAMTLTVAAGCDWIPVRRRLDPSLYPVPVRADATYLRGDPRGSEPVPAAEAGRRIAQAQEADRRDLPPLPGLSPVSPVEVLYPPAPTPLLDAALVRAVAVRGAALDPGPADPSTGVIGPDADSPTNEPTPGSAERGRADLHQDHLDEPEPVTDDIPPMPPEDRPIEAVEPDSGPPPPGPEPVELPPLESIEADSNSGPVPLVDSGGFSPGQAPESLRDEAIPVAPDEHWKAGLENLLSIAEEEAAQGGGSAEVWAARRRALDWVADAEGTVDDATLWQTVMVMLSEPGPAPVGMESSPRSPVSPDAGTPGVEEAPDLRVARVAFCREVIGFGLIDPIDLDSCQAGQDVIVYCELEGVRYEAEGDDLSARLSTTLEIFPEAGEEALWREVHPLEDRCARPRRDFFVGYGLTIPSSLPTGRYQFRVSQRDLRSGFGAIGELAFDIRSTSP